MDINDLRGVSTALVMIAFISICVWSYSKKRKRDFDEAANLPFADEEMNRKTMEKESSND